MKGYLKARLMRNWADRRGGLKPKPDGLDRSDPGTLACRVDQFLTRLTEWNYSPATIISRHWALRGFTRWAEARGLLRPEEVTFAHVEEYRSWLFHHRKLDGAPLSATTQRLRLDGVIGFFRDLRKLRLLATDPTDGLVLPLERGLRLPRVLSIRQIQAVFRLPDPDDPLGLRDRTMLEVLYATGIRRAELAALNLEDLDLEAGVVMVRHGKGSRDRLLPMGERVSEWLRRYLEAVRPLLATGRSGNALFLSGYGERFSARYLGQWVRKLLDEVGIHHPGACHLFRHSCATHMLERGADCRHIQQLLGHARLDTTQIYTHVTAIQLREVHARTHPHGRPDPGDLPPPRRVEPALPAPPATSVDRAASLIPARCPSAAEPAPATPSPPPAVAAAAFVPVALQPAVLSPVPGVSGMATPAAESPAPAETGLPSRGCLLDCPPCIERDRPCERCDVPAAPPLLPTVAPPPLEWAEIVD